MTCVGPITYKWNTTHEREYIGLIGHKLDPLHNLDIYIYHIYYKEDISHCILACYEVWKNIRREITSWYLKEIASKVNYILCVASVLAEYQSNSTTENAVFQIFRLSVSEQSRRFASHHHRVLVFEHNAAWWLKIRIRFPSPSQTRYSQPRHSTTQNETTATSERSKCYPHDFSSLEATSNWSLLALQLLSHIITLVRTLIRK